MELIHQELLYLLSKFELRDHEIIMSAAPEKVWPVEPSPKAVSAVKYDNQRPSTTQKMQLFQSHVTT